MTNAGEGNLIIVTAPSGTGKSTLVQMLLARIPGLTFSVSYTTRAPRAGEQDGKDYYFVAENVFSRMMEAGEFLEWAVVHGQHYGTSAELVDRNLHAGRDVLLDVDVQGATQIVRKRSGCTSIFLLPPSFAELRRRLEGRGTEPEEKIRRRLERARREVHHCHEFDYIVVNTEPESACEEMRAIVLAARCRTARRAEAAGKILDTFR